MNQFHCQSFGNYQIDPLGFDPCVVWEHFSQCANCMQNFLTQEGLPRDRLAHLEFAQELHLAQEVYLHWPKSLDEVPLAAAAAERLIYKRPEIAGYTMDKPLGRGGSGEVWLARQEGLERLVAIKIMSGTVPEQRLRLQRECRILASVSHPHLLPIYANGVQEDRVWMALEYCPGGNLGNCMANPWLPKDAAAFLKKVASAVHAVHEKGIIHRDIKPGNILLGPDGEPRLADFDLAGTVESGSSSKPQAQIMGTPSYISPEQVTSKRVDARVDVHALGAVLYHLLTGRPPFKAETPFETLLLAVHTNPVPPASFNPAVPRDIDQICLKCLAKNPEDRYCSAQELANDLDRFCAGIPVRARPLSIPQKAWRWAIRNKGLAASALGTAISLILVAVTSVVAAIEASRHTGEITNALEDLNKSHQLAKENEEKAHRHAAKAKEYEHKSSLDLYFTRLNQARMSLETGDVRTAQDQLEQCPFSLRGWEHHYLWSLLHAKQIDIANFKNEVKAVALSSDDEFFACGSGNRLQVWNFEDLTKPVISKDLSGRLDCVSFSPNGAQVATGCLDGDISIWDVQSGDLILNLKDSNGCISFVSFSHDGLMLIFSSHAYISILDVKNNRIIKERPFNGSIPNAMALSPAGNSLAYAESGGYLKILTVPDLAVIDRCKADHGIASIAWAPDGRRIAISTDADQDCITIFNANRLQTLSRFGGRNFHANAMAFGKDGRTLATGSSGNKLVIWDSSTGTAIDDLLGHKGSIKSIALHSTCSIVLTGSSDGAAKIWNLNSSLFPVHVNTNNDEIVSTAKEDFKNKRIIYSTLNGNIYLLDDNRLWHHKKVLDTGKVITNLDVSADGSLVAWGSDDHTISIFDLSLDKIITRIKYQGNICNRIQFFNSGEKIALYNDHLDYTIFSCISGEIIDQFNARKFLGQSAKAGIRPQSYFLESESMLVFNAAIDNKLHFISLPKLTIQNTLSFSSKITGFSFSRDEENLIVTCEDKSIYAVKTKLNNACAVVAVCRAKTDILGFSPDGTKFITKDEDGQLRIWSTAWRNCLLAINERKGAVCDALFSRDGETLFASTTGLGIKKYSGNMKSARFNVAENVVKALDSAPEKTPEVTTVRKPDAAQKKEPGNRIARESNLNRKSANVSDHSFEYMDKAILGHHDRLGQMSSLGQMGSLRLFSARSSRSLEEATDLELDPDILHVFDQATGIRRDIAMKDLDRHEKGSILRPRRLEVMADDSGIYLINRSIESENRKFHGQMLRSSFDLRSYFEWSMSRFKMPLINEARIYYIKMLLLRYFSGNRL